MKKSKALMIFWLVLVVTGCRTKIPSGIDLSGEWAFQIDSLDKGVNDKWYQTKLGDKITFPGSMLTNNKGYDVKPDKDWTGGFWNISWFEDEAYAKYRNPDDVKISFWLQPLKRFAGVAWYQKEIVIPENWTEGLTELFLERCHWETSLWIDTTFAGSQNSLSTPHIYRLPGSLSPGKHRLTLRIDNRINAIDPGRDAHSVSDNTQTNWNGVIGEIRLVNRPTVYFAKVQVFPDIASKSIQVRALLNKMPANAENYQIKVMVFSKSDGKSLPQKITKLKSDDSGTVIIDYSMEENFQLWDEFNPNLYTLHIELTGNGHTDTKRIDFGMRRLSAQGKHLMMNGRRIFLRGTLECAIFPKTGYPPTQTAEWARIWQICKNHGLNHIRFHSWCPPKAAFVAADSLGMYLSVECGAWTKVGSGLPIDQFVYDESERIVATYGNHPSFCMMAYGNEPSGENHEKFLADFVSYWKKKDNRRLYTAAHGWANVPENDYQSSPEPRIQHWEEGLKSIINSNPPGTGYDWAKTVERFPQPTVSHEIGQWCVYPNFREMNKYDGVLKPKNFEIFRDRLQENGLTHLADSFLLASGKLQVLCYKADIEAAFRTPDFGGFQLLDLHDFPGQGSAIVGILDAFWDQKGYITPDAFRHFCNTTVPLARMQKLIYINTDTLSVSFEVSHFGETVLTGVVPAWKLAKSDGTVVQEGKLAKQEKIGFGLNTLETVECRLNDVANASKLTLELQVNEYKNQWDIWVYPHQLPDDPDLAGIKVTPVLDKSTLEVLKQGGSVLLTLEKGALKAEYGGDVGIGFSSIFWNTSWTNGQLPHTLGILCNPSHPVFDYFPTEFHSNYQWWDAMSHSNAMLLDKISPQLVPVVRVIDDWFTARPLGLIFECSVGNGKLLVTGIDLINDLKKRTEAKQLLYSLKKYMAGPYFNPQVDVDAKIIQSMYE